MAIQIAPSIDIDILKAIEPFTNTNSYNTYYNPIYTKNSYYPKNQEPWTVEQKVCFLLQQNYLVLPAYADASCFDALVFCQNLDTLTINTQSNNFFLDFEYYKYYRFKNLSIKSCFHWPLSLKAIENLSKMELDTLEILGASYVDIDLVNSFVVPKELGNLQQLKKLSLDHNLLQEIPNELLNLSNLTQLDIYTLQKNLRVPDQLFTLPHLSFASLNYIPENTFPYFSPKVRFNIRISEFGSFFKLVAWKKNFATHWNPTFENIFVHYFNVILRAIHFPIYLFGSDAKSKFGFYCRASIFAILLFLLSPLVILFVLIRYWGSLPELYLKYTKVYRRSAFVYRIAERATDRPSSIEGLGPMGCLGGIFLLLLFFVSDALVPFICRYLFLPLAIILTPIDLVIGAVGKLLERN